MDRRTIHIVDDDRDVADSLALLIHSLQHDPVVWYDPQEFLDQAQLSPGDSIMLDIRMPQLSGWDVMRELRARAAERDRLHDRPWLRSLSAAGPCRRARQHPAQALQQDRTCRRHRGMIR